MSQCNPERGICHYCPHQGYRCSGERCPLNAEIPPPPPDRGEDPHRVIGELSRGKVRVYGERIDYRELDSKLSGHLKFLPLSEGEELVNLLHDHWDDPESREFVHFEMAAAAHGRGNAEMCERHRAQLADPAAFDDDPIPFEDRLYRALARDLQPATPEMLAEFFAGTDPADLPPIVGILPGGSIPLDWTAFTQR